MKKLLSLILALTMALSLFACAKPEEGKTPEEENPAASQNPTDPGEEDDGLVTVYQMISQTEYNADGSKGGFQYLYTYDDMGNLLAMESDVGLANGFWNEETMIYDYIQDPFDGTIDTSSYCTYNERGHIAYFQQVVNGPVTENGQLIDGLDHGWFYTYLDDGRIDTVENYRWIWISNEVGSVPDYDAPTISWKCSYNENKQLTSVVCTTPYEEGSELYQRSCDFKYDEQGRLIEERCYIMEGTRCYRYTYNDQGLLATAEYGWVNVDRFGNLKAEEESFYVTSSFTFFYDEQGRVIDPENNSIRYDEQGRLIALDQYDATITYLPDGGKEVTRAGEKGNKVSLFDEHGNLIRTTNADGSYTQYEYRAIQVTEEQAQRLERMRLLRNGGAHYNTRYFGYEYMNTIDFPYHPLYEYELLERGIRP